MVKERLSADERASARAAARGGAWLLVTDEALLAPEELSPRAAAIVLDLRRGCEAEDGVRIREGFARARAGRPSLRLYVGLVSLDEADLDAALAAVMPAAPDGLLLGEGRGAWGLQQVGAKLAVHEATERRPDGATRVAVVITSARGLLGAPGLPGASRRLEAIGWDAAALSAEIAPGRGAPREVLAHARMLTLVTARAAGVAALDTRSDAAGPGFAAECAGAWQQGFDGKLVTDAAQVAAVAAAFAG